MAPLTRNGQPQPHRVLLRARDHEERHAGNQRSVGEAALVYHEVRFELARMIVEHVLDPEVAPGFLVGAGEEDQAFRDVGRTLGLTAGIAILISAMVLLIKGLVIGLYKITPDVAIYANRALIILACWLIVRSQNMILVVGMMRSGGDTRYSLFLDGVIMWILGVPMAVMGGFILHLPVYWVYLMVMSEELTKCILGLRRYFTRKWIHDLTQTVKLVSPAPDY